MYRLTWYGDDGYLPIPDSVVNKHEDFKSLFLYNPTRDCNFILINSFCPCVAQILLIFLFRDKYEDPHTECACEKNELQQGVDPKFARAVEVYRRSALWRLPTLFQLAADELTKIAEAIPFSQIIRLLSSDAWVFNGPDSYEHSALASLVFDSAVEVREGELEEEGVAGLDGIWEASGYEYDILVAELLRQREQLKEAMRRTQASTEHTG
jgi:hypothetical protein